MAECIEKKRVELVTVTVTAILRPRGSTAKSSGPGPSACQCPRDHLFEMGGGNVVGV